VKFVGSADNNLFNIHFHQDEKEDEEDKEDEALLWKVSRLVWESRNNNKSLSPDNRIMSPSQSRMPRDFAVCM